MCSVFSSSFSRFTLQSVLSRHGFIKDEHPLIHIGYEVMKMGIVLLSSSSNFKFLRTQGLARMSSEIEDFVDGSWCCLSRFTKSKFVVSMLS